MPIYLDHASTSWPKAPGVAQAMAEALDIPGSPGRGGSAGSLRAAKIADDLRGALCSVIGAGEPQRMVLTSGATESLNMAIYGVVEAEWRRDPRPPLIVTTQVEHNAVRRPLADLHRRGRIRLAIVPADAKGVVHERSVVEESWDAALVVMSWISNVTGAVQPVEEVARDLASCRLRGDGCAILLVDGSQSVGIVPEPRGLRPIPMLPDGVDLLAFSGHKALGGPPGVGGLYVGTAAHPLRVGGAGVPEARLIPVHAGGSGGDSASDSMPDELPSRFEPGTPNTPARAGLLAALGGTRRVDTALAHDRWLIHRLVESLTPPPRGLTWHGPARVLDRSGVLSFTLAGYTPEEVAAVLEGELGIIVRAGLHCAPGAHEAIGTLAGGGTVRVSVGSTTTEADMDALADAIRKLAGAV